MRPWKVVVVTLLSIASLYAAFLVGQVTTSRRALVTANLCLTDKAIVNVFVKSFGRYWTPARAYKHPKAYERSRKDTRYFIQSFVKVAPCTINVQLPKDPFKP